ncbi:flagellar export protein FliJ [Silvanigrella paludirubra]|uniref:Flagellar FliJ protein n=1 Tax=Silvanigrella paludirubra TaxID=2499159 RepID=A0A6N6VNJ9_9BACT|nr:flagellar export protein FliJ [Silvanigrella paludirubra]KAB8036116.1 flagellar export protein FliJ [Silvanigrella paludirubra]
MTFRFTLQKILNLREQETRDAELRVEYTRNIINELKRMINEERDFYFNEREELNKSVQLAQMHKISLFERSLTIRQERIMELLDNLRTYQSDLEVFQQALIQSKRNQKIIENLKDIKKKQFLEKESIKEQARLDEIGAQKFLRNQIQERGEE